MAKKKQGLKADTVLKSYWRDNARFADLFNAVLFQGKQVIQPQELEDIDSEGSLVMEHREFAESIQEARDNIKIRKKSTAYGVEFTMLGNESQEHIHYAMPMRVMGYDYGVYKKQYDENARKHKASKGLGKDEYLSRMKRTDKLIPVITLVVYYGEKPWDGAVSLHGMLEIDEEIAPFVNDYKLLLVEARKNDLRLHNLDNVHLFRLLEIFLDKENSLKETRSKAMEYTREHKVGKSVVMAVASATNCVLDYDELDKEGEVDMCTVWEKVMAEGHMEGRIEGRIEGRTEGRIEGRTEGRAEEIVRLGIEFGLSNEDILLRLQKHLDISMQKAQDYFIRFKKQSV
ncbi:transposase [Lachnospiraceae bacterium 29-84]